MIRRLLRRALDDVTGDERPRVEPRKLREVTKKELLVRAAFGAGVSLVAGILGELVNARFGGLFLAFPAILPASLTLIEGRDGKRDAHRSARGAIFGAIGLLAFALAAWALFAHDLWALALTAAMLAWIGVSFGAYALARHLARAPGRAGHGLTTAGR